jgi:hypothetical protein
MICIFSSHGSTLMAAASRFSRSGPDPGGALAIGGKDGSA